MTIHILKSKKIQMMIIFVLLGLFAGASYFYQRSNDTYWLIKLGEYIYYGGIPTIDPLTYHQGLNFISHQWGTALIFFMLNNLFNGYALDILIILVMTLHGFLAFRFAQTISMVNAVFASCLGLVVMILLQRYYVIRPMLLSLLIIAFAFYCLEKYLQYQNTKWVYAVPILSIILVNIHGAVWTILFLIMIPFLCEKYKDINLWSVFILSLCAGLINPYGIKLIYYYYYANTGGSYGIVLNPEMMLSDFLSISALYFTIAIVAVVQILKITNKKIYLRHILTILGLTYMAFVSDRNIVFFAAIVVPISSTYIDFKNLPEYFKKYQFVFSYGLITILILNATYFSFFTQKEVVKNDEQLAGDLVRYMDKNLNKYKVKLYNNGIYGGYLEYCGYRPFIDSRWEVFSKAMNGKNEILRDYVNCQTGAVYYQEIMNKYHVTHVLAMSDSFLKLALEKDKKYRKLFNDKNFSLFEYIGGDGK